MFHEDRFVGVRVSLAIVLQQLVVPLCRTRHDGLLSSWHAVRIAHLQSAKGPGLAKLARPHGPVIYWKACARISPQSFHLQKLVSESFRPRNWGHVLPLLLLYYSRLEPRVE